VTGTLVLVEDNESGIVHKLSVKLLELLERVLVMLTGAFGQDIHSEICVSDFLLVVILVGR